MHHFHNNSWFFCNFTQTKINSKKAQPSECPFFSSPTGPLKNSDTLHLVLNASGTTGLETPPLWEGVKKTYFWEIFPKYRWVRVQIPKLSVTFTNHYFQHKSSQMWVGGAVKTQNQIQILGEIY